MTSPIPIIIIKMRKLYKLLTISNISVDLDQPCEAKQISRVKIRIFEDGDKSRSHSTKFYAQIHNKTLLWNQPFQFRYEAQTKFTFETTCEHQYGYQLEELQVLYKGVYWLKNQMFFRPDSCHVYSPEGEKKGVLKLQIKVVTKQEEEVTQEMAEKVIPLVRQDLIGQIKINNASLEIINPIFNRKRYQNLELLIRFEGEQTIYEPEHDHKWPSLQAKLEYIEDGAKDIQFQMLHEGKQILDGTLCIYPGNIECQQIQKRRRYISHKVTLFNKNGIKIGFLILDLRYVGKQELLDLIYSPGNKLNYSDQYTQRSQSSDTPFPQIIPNITNRLTKGSSLKKHIFIKQSKEKLLPSHRYKIGYQMNQNSDIFMPRAPRFDDMKASNPNISYINPEKSSDFSPKRLKNKYGMSRGNKFDFTRQYKHNPGVGEYQLPSIWSKY